MDTQEETYWIQDAEHKSGTNKYTFTFSPHWRRTNQKALTIGIRSIKFIPAPISVYINGLSLVSANESWNISPSVINNGSINDLASAFEKDRLEKYEHYKAALPNTAFTAQSYNILIDSASRKLIIGVNDHDNTWLNFDTGLVFSEGFRRLVGISDSCFYSDLARLSQEGSAFYPEFSNKYAEYPITVYLNGNTLTRIEFTKLTIYDNMLISASFVDLAYHNWLGKTNEQFVPPKEYHITNADQKFWIELYDMYGEEIELPTDSKDLLIIEAMMNSYI